MSSELWIGMFRLRYDQRVSEAFSGNRIEKSIVSGTLRRKDWRRHCLWVSIKLSRGAELEHFIWMAAICLQAVGVTLEDTRDLLGHQRFIPFGVEEFFSGRGNNISFLQENDVYPLKLVIPLFVMISFNQAFDRKFLDIVKCAQFPSICGQAFSPILTLRQSRAQWALQVSCKSFDNFSLFNHCTGLRLLFQRCNILPLRFWLPDATVRVPYLQATSGQ